MARITKLVALLLALSVGAAVAAPAGSKSAKDRIEASMLVTGWIDIEADGSVGNHQLDEPDKLPPDVVGLLGKAVPGWRFHPVLVDGKPAPVRSRANILVEARKAGEDRYLLGIARATFGSHEDADVPTSARLTPPGYPAGLAAAGVGGTVYLVIKVARDGRVADVMAEQVNLKTIASDHQMQRMRDMFAKVSVARAQRWRFNPPRKPDDAPYWLVRVPVEFVAPGSTQAGYGQWHSYVPGPRAEIPWEGAQDMDAPDTLVAGRVYPTGKQGPELLTPLGSPDS